MGATYSWLGVHLVLSLRTALHKVNELSKEKADVGAL